MSRPRYSARVCKNGPSLSGSMIVQCPQLPVKSPVALLSFHGSGGGLRCEKFWSGFDSASWGRLGGPWGGAAVGLGKNCAQETA